MPAAASPFTPVAQSDEIRSTSCTEEEALHARETETPAKVRGVWKVSVVAAVTGLIAAASTWRSHSERVGDEITGLASTYYPYGTIGCWNWADIEISRTQVADQNVCATLCTNTPGCTMYNWQQNACEPGWPVARGCLLFRSTCTTMRNDCWQLNYKIESPETFFAQTLTVKTSVAQAEAEAAVVAALKAEGIEAVTTAEATGRRLQATGRRLQDVVIITWFHYYTSAATWDLAYKYAQRLAAADPAVSDAFTARCKDNLPDGSTFDVDNYGEPVTAGFSEIIDFNCFDNTTSMLELESCHETKVAVLRLQMGDLPPEVEMNEKLFSDFLLGTHRDYFGGSSVNATEYRARLEVFSATMKLIEERNAAATESGLSNPARHGVTKYADWTADEFAALLGGLGPGEEAPARLRRRLSDAESDSGSEARRLDEAPGNASCSADWSERSQIRNQGGCGNCWTFSTAESIRSATIQQTGQDPGPLSTQYITDCMTITSCNGGRAVNGCCGGNPGRAMLWLEKVQKEGGGIPTQEAYGDIYKPGEVPNEPPQALMVSGPVSEDGNGITYSGNFPFKKFPCKTGIPPAVKLEGGGAVLKTEAEMESYVCGTGSLSILLDAHTWQTYVGGVIDAKSCGTKVDHAVLLVGLNQEENAWLVQNSWGVDFGINTAGQVAPRNFYTNCPQLAGEDKKGCTVQIKVLDNRTVADVCQWSCADEPTKDLTKGGFVWLQFGTNACAIRTEPIIVPYVNVSIV